MSKPPIEVMLDKVDWKATKHDSTTVSELPYATHSGVLDLFGLKLRCYLLNTGERVFDADDIEEFFRKELQP